MPPHSNQGIERRFLISISLTALIFLAELIGSFWTQSLALLSDSAHVFMDIFALGLSYLALRISTRPADDRHTYGYHRLEVLAALVNGLTLGVISIGIFIEAYQRWFHPEPVKSVEMLVIAVIGLVVNLAVALVLGTHAHTSGEGAHIHKDINVQSAFLHVVGDTVSSIGVIVAAILITYTGQDWIDPLMSVFIGVILLVSSARVLKGSLHILVEGVPEGMSLKEIRDTICSTSEVSDLHDLHVWNICSGHVALSAHIVINGNASRQAGVMEEIKKRLADQFNIEHTTIQIETIACPQGHVEDPSAI